MNPEIEQQFQLLERQLHSPDVRADPDKLKALLHDDFNEIGRSSQVYHKADIISHVVDGIHFPTIESQNFQFKHLSQTVVLVTYESYHLERDNTRSYMTLRSYVWLFTNQNWQMIYHQGIPL